MPKRNEDKVKGSILESASKLFARFGPKKTTMDEIAQTAGIGKGTIYYYFTDKENVFAQVIREEAEQLLKRIKAATSRFENPEQKLTALFVEKLVGLAELVNLRWIYDSIKIGTWASLEKETASLAQKEQDLVQEILEQGRNQGLFSVGDAPMIARNLVNIVSAIGKNLPSGLSPVDLRKTIEEILSFIFDGLRLRRELNPEAEQT